MGASLEDVIEECNVDFSNDWDVEDFGTIGVLVTLIGTGSFSESSELFDVLLVGVGNGNLSANFTCFNLVKGLLGGSDGFAEKSLWVESAQFVLELHI